MITYKIESKIKTQGKGEGKKKKNQGQNHDKDPQAGEKDVEGFSEKPFRKALKTVMVR